MYNDLSEYEPIFMMWFFRKPWHIVDMLLILWLSMIDLGVDCSEDGVEAQAVVNKLLNAEMKFVTTGQVS